MRKEIRSFSEQAAIRVQFYHLNELTPEMEVFVRQAGGAPVVMLYEKRIWKPVFTTGDLKKMSGPTEFITSLRQELNSLT
ncbi:hypothetical protein [Robertkochia flava]|uniref:hypothetical protein n=1 Tax=Robertkochia flava TaxID=3447986 RepID=UPI001CCB590B|nr:hypothetical protein [Robertkochia marina]